MIRSDDLAADFCKSGLDISSLEGETIRVEGKLELYKAKDYDFRTGFEVLGIRFGLNPCSLAQKVAQQIADRAVWFSR